MSETILNEPLLQRVLANIEASPELWNQCAWAVETDCGTAHCFAGWAYVLGTGEQLVPAELDNRSASFVPRMARDLLGLTERQAFELFYFTTVRSDEVEENGGTITTHCRWTVPTFEQLCARVQDVTGFTYKPTLELADA